MARITLFWCFEKKIFLSRMMEFQVKFCHQFRTEAVEDRVVIFNQIQVSYVKFPHLINIQIPFLWLKSVFLMPNKWFEVWQSMFKHPVGRASTYLSELQVRSPRRAMCRSAVSVGMVPALARTPFWHVYVHRPTTVS